MRDEVLQLSFTIGARGRNRTGTRVTPRGILSPLRLPVPPPGQIAKRLGSESNRRPRLCRPLHNHSATQPNTVLLPISPRVLLELQNLERETRLELATPTLARL